MLSTELPTASFSEIGNIKKEESCFCYAFAVDLINEVRDEEAGEALRHMLLQK